VRDPAGHDQQLSGRAPQRAIAQRQSLGLVAEALAGRERVAPLPAAGEPGGDEEPVEARRCASETTIRDGGLPASTPVGYVLFRATATSASS
jgi:hypothetical protein